MAIDKEAIKEHIRGILVALGDDPDREGLKETPDRVARMYEEVFEGMNYTNDEIAEMFGKTFKEEDAAHTSDMVFVKDIEVFSYCEHHMALMYDMKVSVAYIPHGRVLGLSKIARIADMVAKRLQLQERIGSDIAYVVGKAAGSPDVAVLIEANHSCMTARGIKKPGTKTYTTTFRGAFENDVNLQNKVILTLSHEEYYYPTDEKTIEESLKGDYILLGVYNRDKLIAASFACEDGLFFSRPITDWMEIPENKIMCQEFVVVDMEYRGNGIQKRFMDATVREANRMGYDNSNFKNSTSGTFHAFFRDDLQKIQLYQCRLRGWDKKDCCKHKASDCSLSWTCNICPGERNDI